MSYKVLVIMIYYLSLIVNVNYASVDDKFNYDNMIGYWELDNKAISISIYKEGLHYKYHVKSTDRDTHGNLEFTKSPNELELSFKSLYAVDPLDMEISASYYNGDILIQNYGNSMNNYLKFSYGGDKYLRFKKLKGISVTLDWQDSIASISAKNISHYYYLLPSHFLDCEQSGFQTLKSRESEIKIKDIKNGYIQFLGNSEITVFKNRKMGIDIIAVQIGGSGAANTCGSVNSLFQLIPECSIWIKRDHLLPENCTHDQLYEKYSDEDILPYFDLPQQGLIIKVLDENSTKEMKKLKWNGEKFIVQK